MWRFYTVPGNPNEPFESPEMEIAAKTWSGGKWWEYGGGGTVWDSMAYDPASLILYILVQVMVRHGIDMSEVLEEGIIYTFHPL